MKREYSRRLSETFKKYVEEMSVGLLFSCILLFPRLMHGEISKHSCTFKFYMDMFTRMPSDALGLLDCMLQLDPVQRISASKALEHPFLTHALGSAPDLHLSQGKCCSLYHQKIRGTCE